MKLFFSPIIVYLKISFLFRSGSQILGRDGQKHRDKTGKTVIFPGIAGKIVQILPWKDGGYLLRVLDPNSPSICAMSMKMSENL